MKSSKKFMTRVLTAALVLSMVAGTGICAAAVEDEEVTEEPEVVLAPEDETPDFSGKLDAIKAILAQTAQGGQS